MVSVVVCLIFYLAIYVELCIYGLVYPALLNAAAVYYMSEWFVERHGLANGVIGAGEFSVTKVCTLRLSLSTRFVSRRASPALDSTFNH